MKSVIFHDCLPKISHLFKSNIYTKLMKDVINSYLAGRFLWRSGLYFQNGFLTFSMVSMFCRVRTTWWHLLTPGKYVGKIYLSLIGSGQICWLFDYLNRVRVYFSSNVPIIVLQCSRMLDSALWKTHSSCNVINKNSTSVTACC
jgi:hypothetical protein